MKFILEFQATQRMDETVLYQQVSSHQRLSATVQARWAATNPARFPRQLEPFLRWIFREYVKERCLKFMAKELWAMKQGMARLRDFIQDLTAKL